ncbi:MAG TPA: hypothetical protein VF516_38725 [Kofleriaceae bacterium]
MRQFCIARMARLVMLVMLGIPGMAAAQAPGQVEPASAPFLEKRVPEELAIEGIVLSRRNLALQIEQLGDRWLVSLVDLTTGRVAASTKVDALPADREAAVAAMTHVVSDLAAQIVGRSEPPPPPPPPVAAPPPPPPPAVIDDRAEREQRELAERKFRRQAIRIGDTLLVTTTGSVVSVSQRWVVRQGDLNLELEPEEFYAKVGRPDLGEAYASRRKLMLGSYIAAGVVLVAGTALAFGLNQHKDCPTNLQDPTYFMCADSNLNADQNKIITSTAALGVSTVGLFVGLWYQLHLHPISENEAKSLADVYNQRLRRELGLPVVVREPLLRDVKLTPFVARSDTGGLALSARF